MKNKTIVIADSETDWVQNVETAFAFYIPKEIQLKVFTDPRLMEEWLGKNDWPDRLIVGDDFLPELSGCPAEKMILLAKSELQDEDSGPYQRVFKYLPFPVLFPQMWQLSGQDKTSGNSAKVVCILGAGGGTGATTISLWLANELACLSQKVLLINATENQDLAFFLPQAGYLSPDKIRFLKQGTGSLSITTKCKPNLFCLPSVHAGRSSFGITADDFVSFIHSTRESGDFGWIIADLGNEGYAFSQLIDRTDFLCIVVQQDPLSVYKLDALSRSVRFDRNNNTVLICNKTDDRCINALLNSGVKTDICFHLQEPIPECDPEINIQPLRQLTHSLFL